MIRKLRLKIVGISVMTVAAVLLSAMVILALSTHSQMVRSSEGRLLSALDGRLDRNELPGSSGQPCFVAEILSGGTIHLSGSSYYNLENEDLVLGIVRSALEQESESGVLHDYSLRYMRRVGTLSVRIAFTDCTMEQATMRSLLLRSGFIALAALVILTGLSYYLAGFAVRPVKQAWQEQTQFISDASHELKTPLTVILSSAELLNQSALPEQAAYIDNIRAEGRRMKLLVEDMLTLSRAQRSAGALPEQTVELSETAVTAALRFEPVAFEAGKRLEYDIAPSLPVRGDGTKLGQALAALLDNAVKYAADGTDIRLTAERQGRFAAVTVENRGADIPADKLPHIFDRFYRADEARTDGDSFGLGLPIAKAIIEAHRGTLRCESGSGVTRFIITLPLTAGKQERGADHV